MKKTVCLATLVGTMTFGAAAWAADQAPAEAAGPPKPAAELVDYMKDILGNWTCATTFAPGALGPNSPEVKTTAKVKLSKENALGGFFYRGEYAVAKSKTVPMAFNGVFFLGYEPGSKQIVNLSMDNTGAAYMGLGPIAGNVASWSGDGYMGGSKMKFRETMTKVDPKNVVHKYEVDMGKGLQQMGEDVCKK